MPLITVKACKKIQSSRLLFIEPLSSNLVGQSSTAQKREDYVEIELTDSNDSLESLDEAVNPLDEDIVNKLNSMASCHSKDSSAKEPPQINSI